jgi:hypothetical protein
MSSPPHIVRKESAIMSVKHPPSPASRLPTTPFIERLLDILLADWWIDVFLMLFIVGCMVWSHYS